MKRFNLFIPVFSVIIVLIILGAGLYTVYIFSSSQPAAAPPTIPSFADFKTDVTHYTVPIERVVPIGLPKNGVKTINKPQFVSSTAAALATSTKGLFVSINGDERFYPIPILSNHYIVNDVIGGEPVAITHHPFTGTSIALNRMFNGELLQFRVSGFVFESNMVMYDTATESLWSQTRRQGIVGAYAGAMLSFYDTQQLSFQELKKKHPQAWVLIAPEGSDSHTLFPDRATTSTSPYPVSKSSRRHPPYEPVYVIPYREVSVALVPSDFDEGRKYTLPIYNVTLTGRRNGSKTLITIDGKPVPGYTEYWFSWFTEHESDGVIWDVPGIQ